MKSPFLVLALASLVCSQESTSPLRLHTIELSFLVGTMSGDILDRDRKLYEDVGLQVVQDNKPETLDPTASGVGLELAGYRRLHPKVALGLGLKAQNFWEKSDPPVKGEDGQDLISTRIVSARLRLVPFWLDEVAFGFDLAGGYGFGTLQRFPIASKNLALIKSGIVQNPPPGRSGQELAATIGDYVTLGHKDLDLGGPHIEILAMVSRTYSNDLGWTIRAGYEGTWWSVQGSDPLESWTPAYPRSLTSHGFVMGFGGQAGF